MTAEESPVVFFAEAVRRLGQIARKHSALRMPGYRGERGHGPPTVDVRPSGHATVTIDPYQDRDAVIFDLVEGLLASQPRHVVGLEVETLGPGPIHAILADDDRRT